MYHQHRIVWSFKLFHFATCYEVASFMPWNSAQTLLTTDTSILMCSLSQLTSKPYPCSQASHAPGGFPRLLDWNGHFWALSESDHHCLHICRIASNQPCSSQKRSNKPSQPHFHRISDLRQLYCVLCSILLSKRLFIASFLSIRLPGQLIHMLHSKAENWVPYHHFSTLFQFPFFLKCRHSNIKQMIEFHSQVLITNPNRLIHQWSKVSRSPIPFRMMNLVCCWRTRCCTLHKIGVTVLSYYCAESKTFILCVGVPAHWTALKPSTSTPCTSRSQPHVCLWNEFTTGTLESWKLSSTTNQHWACQIPQQACKWLLACPQLCIFNTTCYGLHSVIPRSTFSRKVMLELQGPHSRGNEPLNERVKILVNRSVCHFETVWSPLRVPTISFSKSLIIIFFRLMSLLPQLK